ncbi:MAG: hypothetical protein J6Q42_02500 [Clostridia bacterium]|nr:hypothetical protein [Clostridia bacterium]
MAVYTLNFTVTAEKTIPAEPQPAGVFGDHHIAELHFTVPSEPTNCRYRLEITDGSGGYDITELLDAENGVVSYTVPRTWTAAGVAAVRLVAVTVNENGEETLCFHAAPAFLLFEEREDGTALPEMLPAWQQVMNEAEALTDGLRKAWEDGELDGQSGVYVGTGEMPDNCNVQIDPTGESLSEEDIQRLKEVGSGHLQDENNPHKVTLAQIGAAPAGYGLGSVWSKHVVITSLDELDSITENGWYYITTSGVTIENAFSAGHLFVYTHNNNFIIQEFLGALSDYKLRRYKNASYVFSAWVWENPPMTAGVEYRTTDYYFGSHVYKKALHVNANTFVYDSAANTSSLLIPHHIDGAFVLKGVTCILQGVNGVAYDLNSAGANVRTTESGNISISLEGNWKNIDGRVYAEMQYAKG